MKKGLGLFFSFSKKLFKKWILWVFALLDLLGLVVLLLLPNLKVPPYYFLLATVVGLIWASFQVYMDLESKIPGSVAETPKTSRLEIQLMEGSEYRYELEDPPTDALENYHKNPDERSERTALLPFSEVRFSVRVENSGELQVDLLNAQGTIDMSKPLQFLVPEALTLEGKHLKFPARIGPGELLVFQLRDRIHPWIYSVAQVAAGIHEILETRKSQSARLSVDFIDSAGQRITKSIDVEIALRPLCDLYVEYWRKIEEKDLVRLAVGR